METTVGIFDFKVRAWSENVFGELTSSALFRDVRPKEWQPVRHSPARVLRADPGTKSIA